MPYIKKDDRKVFDECLYELSNTVWTEGDLNYCITMLLKLYLEREGLCYKNINRLMGVLECTKQEFYRRAAAPYEDKKIFENGDVYGDI